MRSTSDEARADQEALFAGGGEMGARMRAFDWSRTPLGEPHTWPRSLRTVVRILLTSRFAMWMGYGPDLTFFCNDAYSPTVGVKLPWVLGATARDVWAEIWADIGPRIERVMTTGEATWDEGLLLFLERSGFREETYHTFSYSPIPDDGGRTAGMLCVVTEETERLIGERRSRTVRDLAARCVQAKTVVEVCQAAADTLAENPRDVPFALLYHIEGNQARLVSTAGIEPGEAAAPAVVSLERRARGGWPLDTVAARGEASLVERLGARFSALPTAPWDTPPERAWVLPVTLPGHQRPELLLVAALTPFRPLDDAYRGFFDLVVGQIAAAVADSLAYEEERRRAEALAELDRAKTAFFSNVSHEFRTPLTLMLGPLDDALMTPGVQLAPETSDSLHMAQRNGLRLLRLVNTLLDFSRIEAGRAQASYEPTDVGAYTAELAGLFAPVVERAGLQLVVDCQAPTEPVYLDHEMWEKIVFNLLSNAFKFTLAGEIGVTVRPAGQHVELVVRDTGTGIPADELPHLFERFHRVEGTQGRTYEGTGIGLALVQELVALHGGTIRVDSVLGQGSAFTVSIPLGTAHLPAEHIQAARTLASTALGAAPYVEEAQRWIDEPVARGGSSADEADGTAARPTVRGARILLADDNADMREYGRRLLQTDYQVETFADGEAALAAVRSAPPDLILTDVMMPRLDGFGLLRALRADPRTATIPIILVSARAGEEARVEGLQAGADDYLVKPFSARELLARVGGALELARVRRETATALERQARLLDLTHEPIFVWEWDGPIVFWNAGAERLYGYSRDEAVGRLSHDLLQTTHPQGRAPFLAALQATGEMVAEITHVTRDGTPIAVETRQQLIRAADGSAIVLETNRDVSARVQLQRAREEFLGSAAHDLKTPLTAIKGMSQIAARRARRLGGPDGEGLAETLRRIDGTVNDMVSQINNMLDVVRLQTGLRLALERQPTDLVALVQQQVERHTQAGDSHVLQLDSVDGELVGQWDRPRLERVIGNLLSNAIKYSPHGGTVRVTIGQEHTGDGAWATLAIVDPGIGIPATELSRVFERFYRGSNVGHISGTGIGLAGARQIVEQHGGTIDVASQVGKGTTVTIRLPLQGRDGTQGAG